MYTIIHSLPESSMCAICTWHVHTNCICISILTGVFRISNSNGNISGWRFFTTLKRTWYGSSAQKRSNDGDKAASLTTVKRKFKEFHGGRLSFQVDPAPPPRQQYSFCPGYDWDRAACDLPWERGIPNIRNARNQNNFEQFHWPRWTIHIAD